MPLEPYPHFQADYQNPLNRYSEQLPSYESSPTRGNAPARPTSFHDRQTSYHPEQERSRPTSYQPETQRGRPTSYQPETQRGAPTSYQPEYEDFESLKQRPRPAKAARTWPWTHWSRKRKLIIFGSAGAGLILLIIIIAVAVSVSGSNFKYTPVFDQVTNAEALTQGGATRNNVNATDGVGVGTDTYVYYQGDETNFPPATAWISFEDMWKNNYANMQTACSSLKEGSDNSDSEMQYIYDAIQDRANASLVDHRFILATVLQESNGCPRVGSTTSSGGVRNPGLMQSHNGHAFDSSSPRLSTLQMIQDGTQGTEKGDGLVQGLNLVINPYKAARYYNSGYIPQSGDLSEAAGATACYVTDIANRLTGWTNAKSLCPGDKS